MANAATDEVRTILRPIRSYDENIRLRLLNHPWDGGFVFKHTYDFNIRLIGYCGHHQLSHQARSVRD